MTRLPHTGTAANPEGVPDIVDGHRLTRTEAARALGVHPSTISLMSTRGELPYILVAGRRRYRLADLMALVERPGA